jgi:hypothetical protein
MPRIRSGKWPLRWCWRSCVRKWRCTGMPVRPRWRCSTSPTITPVVAQDILEHLAAELPLVTDWSGTVGVGIVSNNVEYWDEPAMAVMLLEIPGDQYRVFSGVAPLGTGF